MPLLDSLLSLLAPHVCIICKSEGKLVCDWCAPDAFPDIPSRCYRCKRLTSDFAVCDRCQKLTKLRHVWICTEYAGNSQAILKLFKYERAIAAQKVITEAIDVVLPHLPPKTVVIPVPTATKRVRQRGYDQAVLLARGIARCRSWGLSLAVARLTQTRQVGATRRLRLDQLENAFMVIKPDIVKGSNILLVDDVLTTGSTLETMASLLKKAGAKSVSAVVFAEKQ